MKRHEFSLRLRIVGWLLVPLALMSLLSTWQTYDNAHVLANLAYDRTLQASVRSIAERVRVSNGQVWSLAARYRQDALQTGVAFQRNGEQLSGSSLLANHQDFWKAMLRYTLGNTELGVGVEHERMDMAIGRDQRQTAWTAAVTQRLGAWTLGLAYVRLGSRQGADTATVKAADYQADQWALSASYGLSKRTQLYGFYTRLNNHAAATRNFDSSAINGVAAGANPSAVGLGISHQF